MTEEDPNREMLLKVAERLGQLRDEVVFVGGTTLGLLLTDTAGPQPRPTRDVDVIVDVSNWADYHSRLRTALLAAGLVESTVAGDPICAWRLKGVRVDVMPCNPDILGFSNRWYRSAMESAWKANIGSTVIAVVDAPHFVATKLEAFKSRGDHDYYASHDLEDVVALIDGRPELLAELRNAPSQLREFVVAEFRALLRSADFSNALPGHLEDSERESVVKERMEKVAALVHLDGRS